MDIEKLIEQYRNAADYWRKNKPDFPDVASSYEQAATALSTLQAENSQLRDSRDHWKRLAHELSEGVNGKDAEHERLQAENEKLRETVDKYATAARVIALHLKPFCDESLLYDEMIADAARKASDELEQVKRENNALWTYIEIVDGEYRRYMDRGYIDRLDELRRTWKRGQKEG